MIGELSPDEMLARRARGDDFLLLDVRTAQELATASVHGAVHIPMQEIPARIGELEPWRGRDIVVMCHHGVRSDRVARYLADQGFARVHNLLGGIDAVSLLKPEIPRY